MNKILLSTTYFGSIEYYAVIAQNSEVFIDTAEFYPKQTYRTRCNILSPNGIQTLSVPVVKGRIKRNIPIDKIQIDYQHNWIPKHLNSIKTAYGSAPYFEFYFDYFVDIIKQKPANLIELNDLIMRQILQFLQLDTTINYIKPADYSQFENLKFLSDPKYQSKSEFPKYPQVFEDKFGFVPNLSILDLLFNLGPEAINYLKSVRLHY